MDFTRAERKDVVGKKNSPLTPAIPCMDVESEAESKRNRAAEAALLNVDF